ncbi:MAG: hypothetical protein H6907_11530 [Hyphomicrobiales bacterium]|nr:hypothetical protein [Hyphomicrobiales bacterium]MCP5372353.1 hypothetical protein [Hyphomicrobiales bacterium]
MSGIESQILALAMTALSSANAASQRKSAYAAQQTQAQQQIQRYQQEQAIRERERLEKLHRDQATQRARFGARGISSAGGSSSALLEGLQHDTLQDIADDRRRTGWGIDDVNLSLADARRRNLLEESQDRLRVLEGTLKTGLGAYNLLKKS